jgi:hypothetical protein
MDVSGKFINDPRRWYLSRSQIASGVHRQQQHQQHDDAGRRIRANSACGRDTQLKIWIGSTVNGDQMPSGANGT